MILIYRPISLFFGIALSAMPAMASACAGISAADPSEVADALNGLECAPYVELGSGEGVICHWSFDYRADSASHRFKQIVDQISACFPDLISKSDEDVNHPDTYTQAIFSLPTATVAVSLKDKAALSQTLVFLKVTRPN